jgi:hypothetical protein
MFHNIEVQTEDGKDERPERATNGSDRTSLDELNETSR